MNPWTAPRGRVLALAAHPDDETLGCGGALTLHRRRGDRVKVIIVTDGGRGDAGGPLTGLKLAAVRKKETLRAVRELGVTDVEFWNYQDGELARARGVAQKLRSLLRAYKPAVVYRPSLRDPHADHRALARRFETASRGLKVTDCRYEVLFLQRPTAVLDVSSVFERKLAALRRHRTQNVRRDLTTAARKQASLRALFLPACRYAEAFSIR